MYLAFIRSGLASDSEGLVISGRHLIVYLVIHYLEAFVRYAKSRRKCVLKVWPTFETNTAFESLRFDCLFVRN